MATLPVRLQEILKKAEPLLETLNSTCDGGTVYSVEDRVRSTLSIEEDREKRVQLSLLLNELKDFYRSVASKRSDADALVLLEDTSVYAYLTLVPPRSGGRNPDFGALLQEINYRGITQGLNHSAVEAACEKLVKKGELVYKLKIAEAILPTKGDDAAITWQVRAFDKSRLFNPDSPFEGDLADAIENVEAGACVARLLPPTHGSAGTDVKGRPLPPIPGSELQLKFGDGLKISPNGRELQATLGGGVVQSGHHIDVVPFYTVTGDVMPGADISFAGNVLVTGSVVGPLTIRTEDLFVAGRVEVSTVIATGDVWIGGGLVGRKQGLLESDGRVYAGLVSDAVVQALGDVVVRNSITHSEVTSNGRVIVTEERGAIVGGSVSAFRGILVKSVGSDFGTLTSTIVGRDFLTPNRLERIEKRIREHEGNLTKIDLLKRKLAEARVDVTKLPPDKQDIYISVLQKEKRAREELAGLRRGRERFVRSMQDFLDASVQVLEQLHPPVKVQIGATVAEIKERLERVVLWLDAEQHIRAEKKT